MMHHTLHRSSGTLRNIIPKLFHEVYSPRNMGQFKYHCHLIANPSMISGCYFSEGEVKWGRAWMPLEAYKPLFKWHRWSKSLFRVTGGTFVPQVSCCDSVAEHVDMFSCKWLNSRVLKWSWFGFIKRLTFSSMPVTKWHMGTQPSSIFIIGI